MEGVYSDPAVRYEFFADSWNNLYASEMKTGRIFILFSMLPIFKPNRPDCLLHHDQQEDKGNRNKEDIWRLGSGVSPCL